MKSSPLPAWGVGLILFGSGTAALVYQVAWTRELRLIFGASTAATAAVLAVFIGGLGMGGLLFGSKADRAARPLRLYAGLELGASFLAALSPLLLWLVRVIYVALGGSAKLGLFGGSMLRLVLGALVLAPPTLLMGGAMPAAVAAVAADEDRGRRRVALLYGLNTLGAVMGCVLATFLLLETLGTRATLWSAAALGACVALVALFWGSRGKSSEHSPNVESAGAGAEGETVAPAGFVLATAGLVGFAFFLMEIVWYRMLGPLLGGTVFSFGTILATALFGIGLGGAVYGALEARNRRPATLTALAVVSLAEAAAIAIPYAIGDGLALLALFLRPLGGAYGFAGQVAVWSVLAGLVVLPAAVASGIQFPLLIGLLGRGRASVGRHTGLAYAANTLGAIAGSLAGGFGLLPLLSAPGCWLLVSSLLVLAALLSLGMAHRQRGQRPARTSTFAVLAAAVVVAVLLQSSGPTAVWRHSPIAVGRIDPALVANPTARHEFENGARRAIAREDEGVESSVALERATGYAFVLNGKTDGHARVDAGTQVTAGLLGAFLHPSPRRAFVIGLGTGSTSGWLASVPSIDRVDTVEMEPAIANVARACAPVNQNVLANPRHRLIIGDAREALLVRGESYDLIASEPSNPYRAGIASLFTREYYQSVLARLAPNGIFLQWVQAYAIDGETFRTIVATLADVFPQIEIWLTSPFDLLLVATREPIQYQADRLRERMQAEPFRSAFRAAWSTDNLTGVLAHYLAGPKLARGIARTFGSAINTDDRTVVEFGFARSLAGHGTLNAGDVLALARARGLHRPPLEGAAIADSAMVEERGAFSISLGIAGNVGLALDEHQRHRLAALEDWRSGDYVSSLAHWRAQAEAPQNPVEAMVLGDALAVAGDDSALAVAETVRSIWPPVADAIAGRLYLRQGRVGDAGRALMASLVGYQKDPWPPPPFMLRILGVALDAARTNQDLARQLFELLRVPFAVHMMDEARASARVSLARLLPMGPQCAEALDYFEPNILWQPDFLDFRAACYRALHAPLASRAMKDLRHYRRENPAPMPN